MSLPRDFSHTLNQGWGTVKKEKGVAEVEGGGPRREEDVEARAMRVSTNMTKVCKMWV